MCGTRLQAPQPQEPVSAGPQGTGPSILGLDSGPARSEAEERSTPSTSITGPSFLGLGDSNPNTSYLLDDQEEESRGHAGLWVFLVLLLAAVLFGLQFHQQVRQRGMQIYAAVLARINPQSYPAPASPPASAPSSQPENLLTVPPSDKAKEPEAAPSTSDAARPSEPSAGTDHADDAKTESESAAKDETESAGDTSKTTTRASRKKPALARSRRAAAAVPQDDRMLRLAQQYLHGQGVARNCDQGMVYLRESLKRPTAAAASQMGALYATGTCVRQDRVSAYRWFSSALQLDPGNSYLAREREELYGQMSSAERRQAGMQ